MTPSEQEYLKRKVLFTPLTTKAALHSWIELFLEIDFPDSVVDKEMGNSSPMEAIWQVYDHAVRNHDPDFNRVLLMASRDSGKTLAASTLELLQRVDAKRSQVHIASILQQSAKCVEYLRGFLSKPILRDFVMAGNKRLIEILRFQHKKTGDNLTEEQWEELSELEKLDYERVYGYIKVLVMSRDSANSDHVPTEVIDEADLISGEKTRAYEEAKMILTTDTHGNYPITIVLSTRKSSAGLVQKELDNAHETGIKVFKWNILDVCEACPESRHKSQPGADGKLEFRPDLPKIPIYRADNTLSAISEDEFLGLPEDRQKDFQRDEGYVGCLKNCKLFASCQGRLATNQTSTSKFLKKIPVVQNLFRSLPADYAAAQLLCWKPSTEGLVYPRMDRDLHMLSVQEMAKKLTGYDYPATFTKKDLVKLAKERECVFYSGMDHGYTHAFAVVTGFKDGSRMFVFDAFEVIEFDLPQKLVLCDARVKPYNPIIWADTEDPGSNNTFRTHGFRVREWEKGTIISGIEVVRMKLNPTIGEPELFFLRDDEGCEAAYLKTSRYSWKLDTAGDPTEIPNQNDDHTPTALRYLISNVFAPGGKLIVSRTNNRDQGPLMPKGTVDLMYDPNSAWNQMAKNAGVPTKDERDLLKLESSSAKRGIIWSDDE